MNRTFKDQYVSFKFCLVAASGEMHNDDDSPIYMIGDAANDAATSRLPTIPGWTERLYDGCHSELFEVVQVEIGSDDGPQTASFCVCTTQETPSPETLRTIGEVFGSEFARAATPHGLTVRYLGADTIRTWKLSESESLQISLPSFPAPSASTPDDPSANGAGAEQDYEVELMRVAPQTLTTRVTASSSTDASRIALEKAGGLDFGGAEKSADYEVVGVRVAAAPGAAGIPKPGRGR